MGSLTIIRMVVYVWLFNAVVELGRAVGASFILRTFSELYEAFHSGGVINLNLNDSTYAINAVVGLGALFIPFGSERSEEVWDLRGLGRSSFRTVSVIKESCVGYDPSFYAMSSILNIHLPASSRGLPDQEKRSLCLSC